MAGRNARLLFVGLTTSMIGDSLLLLVLAIWAKSLTGSNAAAAWVILCIALPYAAAPLVGRLVDRVRRRPFLIGANLAAALILLPLIGVHDRNDVWIIYLVAVLYGISMVTTTAALNGLLKELFADHTLATANSALRTIQEGLRLGGPLAGAGLFAALGGAAVAVVDAVSFCVAAASLALMRLTEPSPQPSGSHWLREWSAGFRHLRAEPALRHTMVASAVAWLALGLSDSVSFALVDQGLHRPPEFIGVLSAAQGAGCVIGGVICVPLLGRLGELGTIAIGTALLSTGSGLCIPTWLPAVLAGKTTSGVGYALLTIGSVTALQRRTPQALIGRVSTAAETMTSGPQIIAIAIGAALISLLDYRLLLAAVCLTMTPPTFLLWLHRGLAPSKSPGRPRPRAEFTGRGEGA